MNIENEEFPLRTAHDNLILMHRDIHFGGLFDIMLDTYINEKKGTLQEIEVSQIQELKKIEAETKKNLAPLLLSGAETEKVGQAKAAYKRLRELYESKSPHKKIPLLIADLILSEEETPEEEMSAIVKEGSSIVPALLELLKTEAYHDPLFPGYGQAPIHAAECLGRIGDKRAIIALFETIGEGDFFDEDILIDAIKFIGTPAKDFLLKVVQGRPYDFDNEKAAIALIAFKDDDTVSKVCLDLLLQPEVRQHGPLATYLTLACEGLVDEKDRRRFVDLASDPATSRQLSLDIKSVANEWNK